MEDDPFASITIPKPNKDEGKEAEHKAETKPAAKPKSEPRGGRIAQDGKVIAGFPEPKPFPSWPNNYSPENTFMPDEELDFTDLSSLNLEINRARARSFRIKNALADARREETRTAEDYRRAYNRALVGMSGGNAEHRKAMAEIQTEDLYTAKLVAEGVVKELVNLSYTVSRDLDTLKTISDNLRKQLSM